MYRLERADLEWILDSRSPGTSFPSLKQHELKRFGEYRTQRYVLDAFDRNLSTSLRHLANQFSEPSFPWPSAAPSPGSAPSTSLTGSARLIQTSALSSAARGGPATKRSGRAA